MTPSYAFKKGTDYIVIGRPVVESKNPKSELEKFLSSAMKPLIKICGIKSLRHVIAAKDNGAFGMGWFSSKTLQEILEFKRLKI